jgi:hypothetical protein
MPIIKGKGTFLEMISGNGKHAQFFVGGDANDVWVQALGFSPQWSSESQLAFGSSDPVEIDDTYDGITASFDVLETASKLVLATLTDQAVASAVGFDPSGFLESQIIANFQVPGSGGAHIGSVLLKGLKVVGADTQSAVDGVQTKKFDFEGTGVVEYTQKLMVHVETGPITQDEVITPGDTFIAYPTGVYAQLVFAGTTQLAITTGYTETSSAVTILEATSDDVMIVYLVDPAA